MTGEDMKICHNIHTSISSTTQLCENPADYTWAINGMLVFYLIVGNIMLLNLLIAIFTYVSFL